MRRLVSRNSALVSVVVAIRAMPDFKADIRFVARSWRREQAIDAGARKPGIDQAAIGGAESGVQVA